MPYLRAAWGSIEKSVIRVKVQRVLLSLSLIFWHLDFHAPRFFFARRYAPPFPTDVKFLPDHSARERKEQREYSKFNFIRFERE